MATMSEIYNHIIVGKFSPQNGCLADNDTPLFVIPLDRVPLCDAVSHEFSSMKNTSVKSRYGWVKEVSPFSIDDIISKIPEFIERDHRLTEHMISMFRAAQREKAESAMAVDYMLRGVETQSMVLSIHKVIFRRNRIPR